MTDLTNNSYRLPTEMEAERINDIIKYKENKKQFPERSKDIVKAILSSDEYKERQKIILEKKEEKNADRNRLKSVYAETQSLEDEYKRKKQELAELERKLNLDWFEALYASPQMMKRNYIIEKAKKWEYSSEEGQKKLTQIVTILHWLIKEGSIKDTGEWSYHSLTLNPSQH